MKRKIAFLLALALLCLAGCGAPEPVTTSAQPSATQEKPAATDTMPDTNTFPPLICIGGKLYQQMASLPRDTQVDEGLIVGETSAYISITMCPDEDGESNFAPVGSPYARWTTEEYADAYVIQYTWKLDTAWYLLIPADEVGR